jgi:hypothetical protein
VENLAMRSMSKGIHSNNDMADCLWCIGVEGSSRGLYVLINNVGEGFIVYIHVEVFL